MEYSLCEIYGDFAILPTEIIIKILEYVPTRRDLSLVNRIFYDFVCKIDTNKFKLKLIDIDDDCEKFDSIMNSRRLFDEIILLNIRSTDNHVTKNMSNILEKFGSNINQISISNCQLPESYLIELINFLPNLETLSLYDVNYNSTEKDDISLNPEIKYLDIQLCSFIIPRTIHRLPKNTLRYLSINNCILDQQQIGRILENQMNIIHLEFDPYYVNHELVSKLKLEKLKLMSNRHVVLILKAQKNLNSLDLSKSHIGDREFLEICKMKSIKTLRLWVDRISWEILEKIMNLDKLKKLSLNYERLEIEYVNILCKLYLPNVENLHIDFPKLKMINEHFISISINCQNIRHLKIDCQSIGVIPTIVQYFQNLTTLVFGCDSDSSKVINFSTDDLCNMSLRELFIYDNEFNNPTKEQFHSTLSIINLISHSLPNLQKLKITNIISINIEILLSILKGNQNLSCISIEDITVNFQFNEQIIRDIKKYLKKLNYFRLRKIAVNIDEDLIRKLVENHFANVSCKDWKNEMLLKNVKWKMDESL